MAAQGLVSTMSRIVKGVAKNKALLWQLEDEVYPVLLHTMTPGGIEHFEDAIDMPIVMVSYQQEVSPKMWSLFEKYLSLVVGDPDSEEGGMLFEFIQIL